MYYSVFINIYKENVDMARRVGDPEKNVVCVFDVFACLRFSLKVDFIINVSDVFDVFDVFRYFLFKI